MEEYDSVGLGDIMILVSFYFSFLGSISFYCFEVGMKFCYVVFGVLVVRNNEIFFVSFIFEIDVI